VSDLVCIKSGKIKSLTKGKIYTYIRENNGIHNNSDKKYNNIWVINDLGLEKHYSRRRFVTISEWRELKLNKLLNKL
jgi:DNA-directed RNA polymerase subunit N (RpoN/RPB10)